MKRCVKGISQGQSGVTLVELLIVLALIGILVVVGVNMMGGVVAKQRLRTAADEIKNRIRAAQLLSVVRNRPVTVTFDPANGTYWACLETYNHDGNCTNETDFPNNYLNLDSGRTGAVAAATNEINEFLTMTDAYFGDAGTVLTFLPPSGLPVEITDAGDYVDGAVCLRAEPGDSGDAFDVQYSYRRVTVDPIVGRVTMWKNKDGIDAEPDCSSQLPESDPDAIWNAVQ